jgi:hypothetical protein
MDSMSIKKPNLLFLKGISLDDRKKDNIFVEKYCENNAVTVYTDLQVPEYDSYTTLSEYGNSNATTMRGKIIYDSIPKTFNTIDKWPKRTNLRCWNCCRQFNSIPVFIPTDISRNESGEEEIGVHGNFCLFNCAQQYIDEKYNKYNNDHDNKTRMLLIVYSKFNAGRKTVKIIASPDKTEMKMFMGEIGITESQYEEKIFENNNDYTLDHYKLEHFKFAK